MTQDTTQGTKVQGKTQKKWFQNRFDGDRSLRAKWLIGVLIIVLFCALFFCLVSGPTHVPMQTLFNLLFRLDGSETISRRDALILYEIRLPRLILGMLVGASLAVSGVLMQGLFRNPLADPGIVGVASGASLGAVGVIVLGHAFLPSVIAGFFGGWLIVAASFIGGLLSTLLLYKIATRHGRTSVATMLLAGIALAALTGAAMGLLVYMADDKQLRDLTFWTLGSLAGANWARIMVAAPFILLALLLSPFLARGLNALALGEAVAGHLGYPVQRIKTIAVSAVAAGCGAAVAVSGVIGFVGIVVPHVLRLLIGPDHRYLIPASALLGAILLVVADTISRVIVAPAELPIGIITALCGAPFFLWILLRHRGLGGL